MNITNNLYKAPVKTNIPKKLPEALIHRFPPYELYGGKVMNSFIMFKPKRQTERTLMCCYPELIHRDNKDNVPSLLITKILSIPQRCGLGSKMLNFAQQFSKEKGCNGYFHLVAGDFYMPNHVPHVFYYKYGMNTNSRETNDSLFYYALMNKDATYKDFNDVYMYYPPIKNPETKWQRLRRERFCK